MAVFSIQTYFSTAKVKNQIKFSPFPKYNIYIQYYQTGTTSKTKLPSYNRTSAIKTAIRYITLYNIYTIRLSYRVFSVQSLS